MPEFKIVSEIKITMPKYVPFELQIKIMKGLPIKSLIKFRSVSKPWKSIIDSSNFISAFNSHSHPHQIILSFYGTGFVYVIDDYDNSFFPNMSVLSLPLKLRYSSHMIGYSQGLFGFYDSNNSTAAIWNPSIKKSIDIPIPNVLRWPYKTVVAFGVCNATDPMLVKIIFSHDFESKSSIPSQVEVFKLSTRKWISLSNTPRKSLIFDEKMVVMERFIYWLAYDRTPVVDDLNNLILSFDMISEEFTEICLPPSLCLANKVGCLELSKLGESLVVVEDDRRAPKREASVWMMVIEDGSQNSFKKIYTIKAPFGSIGKVVGFGINGQPIIHTDDAVNEQDTLVVYEPDYEHLKDIRISVIGYSGIKCSLVYTGTLLLLHHSDGL